MDHRLKNVLPLLFVAVSLFAASVTTADYIRPPPRKALILTRDPSTQPHQVHISLAGDKHIRVSWMTSDKSAPSRVEYGTSPGNYTSVAEGGEITSYSYLVYKSGIIHHSVIGPLADDTVYFYRCGGKYPEFQLKTPPSKFPITFVVAGDLGQTEWTKSTLGHIQQCKYDVLLLPGDLSYADYVQSHWDTFGMLVQPLASARPWMVTHGNHEIEKIPLVKEWFLSYNTRWKMPFSESGSNSNLYYSFDVTGVHIVMLSSYADHGEQSDQYRWAKANFLKVDRKKTPWLVVIFHVPWYSSNKAHQGEGNAMKEAMEPLLYGAHVDIVFTGHVHAYERSKHVYKGKIDHCGPIHITIGDGGNREGLATRYSEPQPEWSAFRQASFGHGEFEVVNSTHAYWSWHRNNDDESVQSDDAWITSTSWSDPTCNVRNSNERRKILMAP
ncbi:PREDICTED: purple acid phosphatase 18 [Ipomoea nil]|uniref:purple acid phosphatase 18 n=1 Tax=Ipomoea nil TaxID=35883 RepID=UPI000900F933|nr:PREDICTED: purple acid phosphatase 18 [Ipomoea nil]